MNFSLAYQLFRYLAYPLWRHPKGDGEKAPLRLKCNPKIRLEFRCAAITSDAGLLAFRELDDALDLIPIAFD